MPRLPHDNAITRRLRERRKERDDLLEFPEDELAEIIRDVGFSCNLCARCCTRAFNGHVHLLDADVRWLVAHEPAALEPAPFFDFCDHEGILYASGYTVRSVQDAAGSCWFLDQGRCRIYPFRPRVCRVYPYMLHREPDASGTIDWRQISGLDQHGLYNREISPQEACRIARDVIDFERSVLDEEITFLEYTHIFFAENNLRHVRRMYDIQTRRLARGGSVPIRVYDRGRFEMWVIEGTRARRKNGR